jgi:hypothetical protein
MSRINEVKESILQKLNLHNIFSIEKNDIVKLDYGLLNLSIENKNNIENIKKLSRDEKELKLLES